MMKLLTFIMASLMVAFVGATSCRGSVENCTAQAMHFHRRGINAMMGTIDGTRRDPWPGGEIKYCYADFNTRVAFKEHFEAAIQTWIHALGGPASASTGHGLSFEELKSDQNWPTYCFLANRLGAWNPIVPHSTLAIHRWDSPGAQSTVGYAPGPSDANHMKLATDCPWDALRLMIVHELGHVMGFGHEHQRNDRDNHIIFNCERVSGYQESLTKLLTSISPLTHQQARDLLCNDFRTALAVGSTLTDFVYWPTQAMLGPYDKDSVMHYGSRAFSDPGSCSPSTPSGCPITTLNGEYIRTKYQLSAGDVQAARASYPWRE